MREPSRSAIEDVYKRYLGHVAVLVAVKRVHRQSQVSPAAQIRAWRALSLLADEKVTACERATGLLHTATLVEIAEVDRHVAECGDQLLRGLLGSDVVSGDEEHASLGHCVPLATV